MQNWQMSAFVPTILHGCCYCCTDESYFRSCLPPQCHASPCTAALGRKGPFRFGQISCTAESSSRFPMSDHIQTWFSGYLSSILSLHASSSWQWERNSGARAVPQLLSETRRSQSFLQGPNTKYLLGLLIRSKPCVYLKTCRRSGCLAQM